MTRFYDLTKESEQGCGIASNAYDGAACFPIGDPARSLIDMLRWRRPAFTKTERIWLEEWIEPLGVERDTFGNLFKAIPNADGSPSRVIFCAHVDTVHTQGGKQSIEVRDGLIRLAPNERVSNCLGADDTTGCWLLREMILAKRPGLYVFFRAEEIGCQGVSWIVDHNPNFLDKIDAAIEFDRDAKHSVITHQSAARTCSDDFAQSLCDQLSPMFVLDDTGVYTDTNLLAPIVPECTNVSTGHEHQHTTGEAQSLPFAIWLRGKLLELDTSKLVIARDATADPFADWYQDKCAWTYYRDERLEGDVLTAMWDHDRDTLGGPSDDLVDLVRRYPDHVADILEFDGWSAEDLRARVAEHYQVRMKSAL